MGNIEDLEKAKNNAYWERNQLVAALSRIFPSYLAKHPESDKEWEDDWRTIVCITLPIGQLDNPGLQLTWHVHNSDVPMFDHLNYNHRHIWDGHGTEEKYRRLRKFTSLAFMTLTKRAKDE